MKAKFFEMAKILHTPIKSVLSMVYTVEAKLLRNLNKNPKKLNIGGGQLV